jgi:hypothetical protein
MAGHIRCVICDKPIEKHGDGTYADSWCWTDPSGNSCAAHGACLRRLGERDLGLTPAR